MKTKVDLHTHSIASPDGSITAKQYLNAIESGLVDVVAITDHNRIDFALDLHNEIGDEIIVGEEIMSSEGEIIGLFLTHEIKPGLTPLQTIDAIKAQDGIVYIPHPFETVRKGLHPSIVDELQNEIDIIEVCNGRAFFQNKSEQAVVWAKTNGKPGSASSDAHGHKGLGSTYTVLSDIPTRDTLVRLMSEGIPITSRPTVRALLYPKLNRVRKTIGRIK